MATTKGNSIRKFFTQSATDVGQALNGLVFAGDVVTVDISAAWVAIEPGYILRIYTTADIYIAFDEFDQGATAVTSATSPGALLKANNYYNIIASGNFMRTSANPVRVEKIQL